jgi:hypothetical protein
MAQKPMETSQDVIYKDLVKIREVSKNLTRVPKIVCYSSQKCPETDVFHEVIKFETVWLGDHPGGAMP